MPFFLTSNFELKKESLIKGMVMFFYSSWPSGTISELFLHHSVKTDSLVIIHIYTKNSGIFLPSRSFLFCFVFFYETYFPKKYFCIFIVVNNNFYFFHTSIIRTTVLRCHTEAFFIGPNNLSIFVTKTYPAIIFI